LQKKDVIENRILFAAHDDDHLSVQHSGNRQCVQVNGSAVGDVLPAFYEEKFLSLTDTVQKFIKLFTGGRFIQHVKKLGMVKTDAHVLRIFVQPEKVCDQGGVIIPQPLLSVQESLPKRFDIADLPV